MAITVEQQIKKLSDIVKKQAEELNEFKDKFNTDISVYKYQLKKESLVTLTETRDVAQATVDRLNKAIQESNRMIALHTAVLHQNCSNPDYTYKTEYHPLGVAVGVLTPSGRGWEINKFKGEQGYFSDKKNQEVYWMRLSIEK